MNRIALRLWVDRTIRSAMRERQYVALKQLAEHAAESNSTGPPHRPMPMAPARAALRRRRIDVEGSVRARARTVWPAGVPRVRSGSSGAGIGMDCVACGSTEVTERPERTAQGYRRFRCR